MYNLSQWHWIADRVAEGYSMKECGDFLGMTGTSVQRNLERFGRRIPLDERVDLNERAAEFNALMDDDSPVKNGECPVIGTDREGNVVQYESLTQAGIAVGTTVDQICNAIKYGYRCRGYKWEKL